MKVKYPSEAKGQLFIPVMNLLMFLGCAGVIIYFREASKMEAAYGLAIIITMIATTILFANYMVLHRVKRKVGELGGLGVAVDRDHAAFVVKLIEHTIPMPPCARRATFRFPNYRASRRAGGSLVPY